MPELHKLTVSEEQACWQEYCRLLDLSASESLRDASEEAKWAAHWETVFSLLDKAERSADVDAAVFGTK